MVFGKRTVEGIGFAILTLALCLPPRGADAALSSDEPEIQWSSPKPVTNRLNPTSRPLNLPLPLRYRKGDIGDINARIDPNDKIFLPLEEVLKLLRPLLKEQAYAELAAQPAPDGHIALQDLRAAGYDIRFDPGLVALSVNLTVDQKARDSLSLNPQRDRIDSSNAVPPTDFSAYVNTFLGVDYLSQSSIDDGTGFKNPRLDMQGAMNLYTWVLEAEATVESDDDFNRQNIKRRGSRLVKDWQDKALRFKIGDVDPNVTSFQRGAGLFGVTVEHNISKLQPGKDIRATSRRSFRIERDADVDILVNGQIMRSMRLAAGDYNLSDLPLTQGANFITLVIRDDVGNEQTLDFTTFLDGQLLSPEVSEWALSTGIKSEADDGEPSYQEDQYVASAYYRRGINETMTDEVNLQGDEKVVMGGAGLLFGTTLGFMNIEGASSFMSGGDAGFALNYDYQVARHLLDWGDGFSRSLNASAEYRSESFAAVGDEDPQNDIWLNLSAAYGQQLWWDTSMSLSANYGFGRGDTGNFYRSTLGLSKSLGPYLSGGLSFSYTHDDGSNTAVASDDDQSDEFSAQLRLSWRPTSDTTVTASHDTNSNASRVNYSHAEGQGVGSWSTSLSADHQAEDFGENDQLSLGGSFNYTANRANISIDHGTRFSGLDTSMEENRTSLRLETAFACAGTHCGIGRPISGPFAVIQPHVNIADKQVVINPNGGSAEAYSDWMGPAVVSGISTYSTSRVTYDVDDLPVGYDLGAGAFDFIAPYKSGYALTVGSANTVTAFGTMVDAYGEPVKLISGSAWQDENPAQKVTIFTNRAGRFGAQGLAPGKWNVEMNTEPSSRYVIEVPEDTVGLFKAGTIKPVK